MLGVGHKFGNRTRHGSVGVCNDDLWGVGGGGGST